MTADLIDELIVSVIRSAQYLISPGCQRLIVRYAI